MKFSKPYPLQEIATLLDAEIIGNQNVTVLGMNEIHVVEPGDLVFIDHEKYYNKAFNSVASVILTDREIPNPQNKSLLISSDPFRDFNKLISYFQPFILSDVSTSKSAQIDTSSIIHPSCFIGNHVIIGKNCVIDAHVSIYSDTIIGDNVIIQAGTVIGSNGFYYQKKQGKYQRLLSGGGVFIENDVEIGALCTIDKGISGKTRIGAGTKLDNQVHVGHDTIIGANCLISAQTGIAGCAIIENDVTMWGQVGVVSGVKIGANAVIMAQTGVTKSIPGHKKYFGMPVQELSTKLKQVAYTKKLPELFSKIQKH